MGIVIWLGIYPLITGVIVLVFLWINKWQWPIPLRTLAITLVVVPTMTYVVLPFLQRQLRNWLAK